jgi:hypothetical protein
MIDDPRIATRALLEGWAKLGHENAILALHANPGAALFGVEDRGQPRGTIFAGFLAEDRAQTWLNEW